MIAKTHFWYIFQLSCATCTILLSITSQLAQIYNETITESLQRYCTYLPVNYQPECQSLAQLLGPFITSEITDEGFSPDLVCYSLNICYRRNFLKVVCFSLSNSSIFWCLQIWNLVKYWFLERLKLILWHKSKF